MRLAITSGDPAGVGPEICATAIQTLLMRHTKVQFHLYGDSDLFSGVFKSLERVQLHHTPCAVRPIPGQADPANGAYVMGLIESATRDVLAGHIDALITAPLAKSVIYGAGFTFPGHTEYLGHLAGDATTHMMLTSPDLRVVPVTLHQSLKSAISGLTIPKIVAAAQAAHTALQHYFKIAHPRLVICGLNPHAGENGAMGDEDEGIVRPAVKSLQAMGLNIRGPLPADTLFHATARQGYDCALGLYHDQALIPIKALAFEQAVNLTLGLPFIRTSPDHGTAFDIAGQGKADSRSMICAMELAMKLAA